MATKFKFEIESDGLNTAQTLAFRTFIGTLGGTEFLEQIRQEELKETSEQEERQNSPGPAKKKRASRAKAEEAQAEEAQAEEPQPKPTKTSTFSIQDVRDRVREKQVKWRTSIKAELERLGSSSVTLLDPKHFEEFCNFMDNLA